MIQGAYRVLPTPGKVSDANHRGATTEPYGAIRSKHGSAQGGEEQSKATPPLDFARDREPVQRLIERQTMPC